MLAKENHQRTTPAKIKVKIHHLSLLTPSLIFSPGLLFRLWLKNYDSCCASKQGDVLQTDCEWDCIFHRGGGTLLCCLVSIMQQSKASIHTSFRRLNYAFLSLILPALQNSTPTNLLVRSFKPIFTLILCQQVSKSWAVSCCQTIHSTGVYSKQASGVKLFYRAQMQRPTSSRSPKERMSG